MLTPFTILTSIAAPLLRDNVDTDAIIPSREMRSTGKTGLADGLFAPWRYLDVDARVPNPEFVLNRPEFANAQILLGGANFGCGSSREHAVWALGEWGIRCVIAESFAPIFRGNCVRNGLLPIELGTPVPSEWGGAEVAIDLTAQTVAGTHFEIEPEAKAMLFESLDVIDLTLKSRDTIAAWTAADRRARPWVYLKPPQSPIGEGDHAKHGGGVSPQTPLPPAKTNKTVVRARELRRNMSLPENMLWQVLRGRPGGLKFRRQHPAGPFILDFYCAAARLCVEVDGATHDLGNRPTADARRDRYLAEAGIETLRFPATAVLTRMEDVIAGIVLRAEGRIPLHHPAGGPPPQSESGEAP